MGGLQILQGKAKGHRDPETQWKDEMNAWSRKSFTACYKNINTVFFLLQ
jgi:hypothetical protein